MISKGFYAFGTQKLVNNCLNFLQIWELVQNRLLWYNEHDLQPFILADNILLFFEAQNLKKVYALGMDCDVLLDFLICQFYLMKPLVKRITDYVVQQLMDNLQDLKELRLCLSIILVLPLQTNLEVHKYFTTNFFTQVDVLLS